MNEWDDDDDDDDDDEDDDEGQKIGLLKKIKAAANANEWDELLLASIWPMLTTSYSRLLEQNHPL